MRGAIITSSNAGTGTVNCDQMRPIIPLRSNAIKCNRTRINAEQMPILVRQIVFFRIKRRFTAYVLMPESLETLEILLNIFLLRNALFSMQEMVDPKTK